METFKAVEKEMKTKAYSKEGLSAATKLDPREKEKLETGEMLSELVDELDRQIEQIEAEAEQLQANMKKGKKDSGKAERISELERIAERHKWHQGKLELLRRALENGGVQTDEVKAIEDGIKYYVENNQEVDFMEDDSIYDDFNLNEEEDLYGMNNDNDHVSSQDAQSIAEDQPEPEAPMRSGSVSAPKPKSTSIPDVPAVAAARRPSMQKSPLPALATLHTSLPTNVNGAQSASNMKPAPLPTIPTGQPLKYASAAAAAAASDKSGVGIAPLPPPPGAAVSAAPSRTSTTASPAVAPAQPATAEPSPSQQAPPSPVKADEPSRTVAQSPAPSAAKKEATPMAEAAAAPSQKPTPAVEKAQPVKDTRPQSLDSGVALTNGNASKSEADDEESIYHLPSSLQDLVESFKATKARVSSSQPVDERMLNLSRAACPSPFDAEKPNHYKPQNPYPYTPSHYPQEPLSIFEDVRLYNRIDTDTLFYAFYYRQGTYQQYLAAKALKSQSWRFHKQYQTWFQRHEEPKNITEEYEQGTYRFFDYESTWYVLAHFD